MVCAGLDEDSEGAVISPAFALIREFVCVCVCVCVCARVSSGVQSFSRFMTQPHVVLWKHRAEHLEFLVN